MVVGLSQSLAQQSGTVSRISSGTRQSALTLSDVYGRRICLCDTSACSALEVDNFMRYINLLTYLLTYLLPVPVHQKARGYYICCPNHSIWLQRYRYSEPRFKRREIENRELRRSRAAAASRTATQPIRQRSARRTAAASALEYLELRSDDPQQHCIQCQSS